MVSIEQLDTSVCNNGGKKQCFLWLFCKHQTDHHDRKQMSEELSFKQHRKNNFLKCWFCYFIILDFQKTHFQNLHYSALYLAVPHCISLFCIISLFCTVSLFHTVSLFCTVSLFHTVSLFCTDPCCFALFRTVLLFRSVLHCSALILTVLHWSLLLCTVPRCLAVSHCYLLN